MFWSTFGRIHLKIKTLYYKNTHFNFLCFVVVVVVFLLFFHQQFREIARHSQNCKTFPKWLKYLSVLRALSEKCCQALEVSENRPVDLLSLFPSLEHMYFGHSQWHAKTGLYSAQSERELGHSAKAVSANRVMGPYFPYHINPFTVQLLYKWSWINYTINLHLNQKWYWEAMTILDKICAKLSLIKMQS